MNVKRFVVGILWLSIIIMIQAAEPLDKPTASTGKTLYKIEAKLIEENSWWNFWSKEKAICEPKVITTEGTWCTLRFISQIYLGDWDTPCDFGVILRLKVSPFKDGNLYLSGNVQIRTLVEKYSNQKSKHFQWNVKGEETWFFIQLQTLPQTIILPDIKSNNVDCRMEITIMPIDGKGNPLPPRTLKINNPGSTDNGPSVGSGLGSR